MVAPLEAVVSLDARTRGLLGRGGIDGAMLIRPAVTVHTVGMRFDLDVAFVERDLIVLRVVTMRRNRLSRLVLQARAVLEAQTGAFARWGLLPGARLEVLDG